MPVPNLNRTIKNLQRLRQIINVFAKHGFGHLIERLNLKGYARIRGRFFRLRKGDIEISRRSFAERLRMAFEELGATFVKLAQILSTRADIIPQEFIDEFKKLQSSATPFSFEHVDRIITEDLKKPADQIFAEFEQTPFAAASIAQVHRAKLRSDAGNGESVVVKIQRPGMAQVVETDLNILLALARLLERRVTESRLYNPTGLINEFAQSIRRELDFTTEGANTDYFYRNYKNNKMLKIPKVHWESSSRRILTLEEIKGVKIDDTHVLNETGLDKEKIALNCLEIFFDQIFSHGFFHADPHPGNILVMPDGRLGLVDFGMVGRLSGEMLRYITSWFFALLNRDVDQIVKIYLRMGIIGDDTNVAQLKMELADFLDRVFIMPLNKISIAGLIEESLSASIRHKIQMPANVLMLGKTIVTIESLVRRLYPDFDVLSFGKPYAAKLMFKQFEPSRWFKDTFGIFQDVADMTKELPLQLNQILKKLQKGNLKLEFELTSLNRFITELDKISNRLAFSIIIAALIVGSSIIIGQDVGQKAFGYPALGLIGYLIAGIFGLGLVISIWRSGKF